MRPPLREVSCLERTRLCIYVEYKSCVYVLEYIHNVDQSAHILVVDLQQMAGLQASLSSLGSQFQGTTGANNILQATNTLSNYSSLQARTMFARGTGTKYSGLQGQAQLMQDMQDMNKNPASMSRVLNNYMDYSHGNSQIAAYQISSQNPNISMDAAEKLLDANSKVLLGLIIFSRLLTPFLTIIVCKLELCLLGEPGLNTLVYRVKPN